MPVMDAARNMAEDYPGGAKALALRIDKNPTTFTHELNGTGAAKLGLVDVVKASKRAKDMRVLNAFAEEMGCMVLQLPEGIVADDDALHLVSKLAQEFNSLISEFVDAVSDGKVTGNEISQIRRQWAELQVVGQRVVAHAEQLHETNKPAHLRAVGHASE